MYIQDGFNDIQSSSRCRMYKEIKQVHKPEAYLKSWRTENHTPYYYWLNQSK